MKFINNKLALAICISLSITACSPEKTTEEYLSTAKAKISSSDNTDAIIALKNAIRLDLNNAEARQLLGSLYLKMGDAAAAEKELTRAVGLTGDTSTVLPKLLKALNLQNKSDETIALVADIEQVTPEILLYQALAYNRIGEKEKAKQTIEQANDLSTESIYSQLGSAYLKADSSDIDGAIENVNKILAVDPELTEALILQGQLFFAKQDFDNALIAFNKYYQLLPNDLKIRLFLANSYVKNEQFDEAQKHLNFLLKVAPEHAFTNQLKGITFYQKPDYKQALAHTEKAIQNGLNTPSNRIVAGLSAFKLEQYELAHQYLVTLSGVLPSTHPVRKVLGVVQIQLGYNVDASDTLTEVEGISAQDVNLFTTASFELLKSGNVEEAKKLLEKTDSMLVENPEDMTTIGILKLSLNDLEGVLDLEKAVELDPELPMAKMALASAYINSKYYNKALSLANSWKESNPEQVEGYNLAAKIYLLTKDTAAAEAEMNLALNIDENNPYTLLYFASKALVNKEPQESIKLLEQLLVASPKNIQGLMLNYSAHKALNSSEIAIERIAKVFSDNSKDVSYRLLYARILFVEKRFEDVIDLLKATEDKSTIPTQQWVLLSDSYLQLKQTEEALAVYDNWIKTQPQFRVAWLKKISTQEKLADYTGALSTVKQVLVKAPKDGQFNLLRIHYLVLSKQFSEAQVQIDRLTDEQRELPLTKGLQGQIWLTEGKISQAVPGLEALYEIVHSPYNAALLFSTYIELGRKKAAFDFLKNHVETFPTDNITRNLLAENSVNSEPALAKKHFLILLKLAPDNISILNNLAWIEYQQGNYQSADKFIKSAIELDTEHPQILDTAGLIQLKLGNKNKAVELLTKAKDLAPNDKQIALHYKEATQ